MPAWHENPNLRDWLFGWFYSFLSFFQSRPEGGELGEQLLMGVAVTDQLVLDALYSVLSCDVTVGGWVCALVSREARRWVHTEPVLSDPSFFSGPHPLLLSRQWNLSVLSNTLSSYTVIPVGVTQFQFSLISDETFCVSFPCCCCKKLPQTQCYKQHKSIVLQCSSLVFQNGSRWLTSRCLQDCVPSGGTGEKPFS